MGKVYGYIRISTKEQNEERQKIALKQVVVEKDRITYSDSSCCSSRPGRYGSQFPANDWYFFSGFCDCGTYFFTSGSGLYNYRQRIVP